MHFDADDEEDFLHIEGQWFTATTLLEYWRSVLDDLGQDGWVRNESYEKVVEMNRRLKREWLDAELGRVRPGSNPYQSLK